MTMGCEEFDTCKAMPWVGGGSNCTTAPVTDKVRHAANLTSCGSSQNLLLLRTLT